jgi:PIN domain nuclease of toxin-antitoxin system
MAADAELFVSAASWWELAIKVRAGRIDVDLAKMRAALEHRKVQELVVTFAHAEAAASLPPLHGDPFDRMMVAQAFLEKLTLMTRDRELARYGSMVLAV